MRTISYEHDEIVQFDPEGDWYVFTKDFVVHAPFNKLLAIIDGWLDSEHNIVTLEGYELIHAATEYLETLA